MESESDSDDSFCEQNAALNEYEGFCPPHGITYVTDRIPADSKPADFFESYVKTRRPAVFSGLLADSAFKGHKWTNLYMSSKAGEAKVLVEDRKGAHCDLSFGTSAAKIEMKYADFVKAITAGETRYYLTTQDLERFVDECDEFGMPRCIVAQPLHALNDSYPAQPAVLGNLIPHQVSLWQGCTGKGSSSSSGLHHDFHDNLYLLIRGRKRFRLFPPSAANFLRVSGRLSKIYRNGLIVYEQMSPWGKPSSVSVRADGAPLSVVARCRQREAERNLEAAENKLRQLCSVNMPVDAKEMQAKMEAAKQLVADCEEQMDSAMKYLLRYPADDQDTDEEGDCGGNSGDREEPSAKRPKPEVSQSGDAEDVQISLLDHFCDVKLPSEDCDDWQTLFSQFDQPDQVGCMAVDLHAGEMLYLPASWFHEVTSYDDDSQFKEEADTAGHLALNYWMYPPDGETFEQPYKDSFWPRRWAEICAGSDTASPSSETE